MTTMLSYSNQLDTTFRKVKKNRWSKFWDRGQNMPFLAILGHFGVFLTLKSAPRATQRVIPDMTPILSHCNQLDTIF